jgi:hypothetical protein
MPGAHQATVFVDAAAGEVGTQVAALATDSEVIAVVADGYSSTPVTVPSGTLAAGTE